jgi:ABC-type antimicrobial peptide transport system permease subunit
MLVYSQREVLSALKAVGVSTRTLSIIIFIEGLLSSGIGGVLGIGTSVLVAPALNQFLE